MVNELNLVYLSLYDFLLPWIRESVYTHKCYNKVNTLQIFYRVSLIVSVILIPTINSPQSPHSRPTMTTI